MFLLNAFSFLNNLSFFGIIWLIILFFVFKNIWTDSGRSDSSKLIWSLVVFFFPVGGVILWWLFGK